MKILTTVAVVASLSSLAVAQPSNGPVNAPGSAVEAPASPPAPGSAVEAPASPPAPGSAVEAPASPPASGSAVEAPASPPASGSAVEAPASPPAPFVVPVPPTNSAVAVTAELTLSSFGVGPEVGLDFGYGGLSAGIAVLPFYGWRSYVKARVQNKRPLAFYGAVGFVYSEDEHDVHTVDIVIDPDFQFGRDYIETYSAVMFEGGVKLQRGSTILRAFVGADLELSSYCSPSDCAATPVFGGIAIGVALK